MCLLVAQALFLLAASLTTVRSQLTLTRLPSALLVAVLQSDEVNSGRHCCPIAAVRGKPEVGFWGPNSDIGPSGGVAVHALIDWAEFTGGLGVLLTDERVERRLAAVLAADVAGYSRLMGLDEEGTLAQLKAIRKALVDPTIATHRGRIVKTTGDGMLVEFASAVDAARGAAEVQRGMAKQNADVPQDQRIEFRIGIHVGDIIFDDNDIFGDGVNIAARLEGIAEPGGICVSDDAQRQIRGKIDLAFDDMGPQSLKNIAEPMRAWRLQIDKGSPSTTPKKTVVEAAQPLALPDKPSIAVLPFQNMSGDPEQEYFADGMVEDIITALSRFKSLFVIARNSTFIYKGKPVEIKRVGEELGVRYVLEGSVRKVGNRLRITGQLIEVATDSHIWADKFDGAIEDVFDLQDQITTKVVGLIAPQIERAEIERAKRKPPADLDSHDYFMRGMALVHKYEFSEETRLLFQKAWKLNLDYAAAYAMDSWVSMNQQATFGIDLSDERRAEAVRLAESAAELANDDALALARAAHVLVYFDRQFDRAMSLVDRAVALNPNQGSVWHARGLVALMCCNPDEAIQSLAQSIRFNPRDPGVRASWIGSSYALWMKGQSEEGFALATKAIQFRPTPYSLGAYILNAVSAGKIDQAREAVRQSLKMAPDLRVSRIVRRQIWRDPNMVERAAGCLRDAGLPE
jgi:TolB-like protein/class 3 adenylate cyclase